MGRMNRQMDESIDKVESLNRTFGTMTKSGALVAGFGAGAAAALLAPAKSTFDTQKALGELATVAVKDLDTMEKAAKDFSNTWAGTTKDEFITAAYDIKSGISQLTDESVARYTEIAGITAKATKANTAEMTSLFATGYGIYKDYYDKMTDLEFGEMFSAGIAKSVQDYKTTGSGMAQAIERLGSSATSSLVPLEEQLVILGTLQRTMSGSEAGTKYNAFLRTVTKAGDELGLSFVDANNKLLSTPEILETLRLKFGDTLDEAEKVDIKKAFGSDEAMAFITGLYDKSSQLQDGIVSMHAEMSNGIDLAKGMADIINQRAPDQYEILTQQAHNLREEIGVQLLPAMVAFMSKISELISKADDWVGKNQDTVKTIMMILLALSGFAVAAGTTAAVIGTVGFTVTKLMMAARVLGAGLGLIKGGFITLRIASMYAGDGIAMFGGKLLTGAGAAKTFIFGLGNMAKQAIITGAQALPGLIASVWSFTAALLANPVTWIVVGIVALIAALYLLWQNWDAVTGFVTGKWNEFIIFIGNGWTMVIGIFKDGLGNIKAFIFGAGDWFKESGAKIMDTFTTGIKSKIMGPVDAVKGGLDKIRKMLPFSDAKEGPLSTLTLSGKRVFETIGTGMLKTQHIPSDITNSAFSNMDVPEQTDYSVKVASARPEIKRVSFNNSTSKESSNKETYKESNSGTIIQKLILHVDINKLKDLDIFYKFMDEMKEKALSMGYEDYDVELVG